MLEQPGNKPEKNLERLAQEADIGLEIEEWDEHLQKLAEDIEQAKSAIEEIRASIKSSEEFDQQMLGLFDADDPADDRERSQVLASGEKHREMEQQFLRRAGQQLQTLESMRGQYWSSREQLIEARRRLLQAWAELDKKG